MRTHDKNETALTPTIKFDPKGENQGALPIEANTSGTWQTTIHENDTWKVTGTIPSGNSANIDGLATLIIGDGTNPIDFCDNILDYDVITPKDQPDMLHHAVGVLIPFGVELEKVRFAKIDRAINNRQTVENSLVS